MSNAYWGYGNRNRNETQSNAERPRAPNCKLDREIARSSVFGPHAIPLPIKGAGELERSAYTNLPTS